MTRRELLKLASGAAIGITASSDPGWLFAEETLRMAEAAADHLLLGSPDLDRGMRLVREATGLDPVIGGSHPGVGTRNALLSLGSQYLEVIAPDPAQAAYSFRMDLRKLREPRLITWAALSKDIEATAQRAGQAGLQVIGPSEGSRKKPDGTLLSWTTLAIQNSYADATVLPIPFFIQWGQGVPHPSKEPSTSCRLQSLEFEHPDPAGLEEMLRKLGINAKVKHSGEPRLIAVIGTPKGNWKLS